ncbi:MAG: hypothetical protein Q8R53_00510 [Nanoarchaeota archaeon]|nr:hypothetical protein [Nanoarchaeota archaeon]
MGDKRKRISWFAQGAISTVLLSSYIHHFGDEACSATPEERSFEHEIGVPIFLNETAQRAERSAFINRFAETYREARDNWDFFDEQFAPIRYLTIEKLDADFEVGWYNPFFHGLSLSCTEDAHYCIEDDDFVHEIGHVWYFALPTGERQRLRNEWKHISNGEFQCSSLEMLMGDCDFMKDCEPASRDLATISCYATTHILEDMAETMMFVYLLNNPHHRLPGMPRPQPEFRDFNLEEEPDLTGGTHFSAESFPRIRQKIELLAEYRAFSERERDYALQQLEAYERREEREQEE